MDGYLTILNGKLRRVGSSLMPARRVENEEGEEDIEPCCCCEYGCVITTATLIRPIVWPGVERCLVGWLKYEKVCDIPPQCRGNTDWRLINLPTCEIVATGKIRNGKLDGLKNRACYQMPYGAGGLPNPDYPECTGGAPIKFVSWLWLPLAYLAYAADLLNLETLVALFSSTFVALHCDGDLSCRYVLQLQTGCLKNGKILWPGDDPCVPDTPDHGGGQWGGEGGDFPVP